MAQEDGDPTDLTENGLEERAALRVLDSLDRRAPTDSEEWELERGYLELMGLLPHGLEPVSPSPEVKGRLMAQIDGERQTASVVPFQRPESLPAPDAQRRPSWSVAIAAALALLTVGFAGWGGWLSLRLSDEQTAVAQLREQVDLMAVETAQLEEIRAELAALEERHTVVTSSDLRVCPLSATGEALEQPRASARVYMSRARHGWVLAAEDVDPCPLGRSFHVWFRTSDGVVSGGRFMVEKGERIEISADDLPEGTNAVMITLETEDEPAQPTGPTVFYGDETHVL